MAYEIDLQTMDNYVRVHVTGERRYGDAAMEASQAGQKIVEYCRQTDIYRVLVVLNLRGRLSAIDSLEIVTRSQEYGWDYSVKAFNDEAKAVDWLLDRPAQEHRGGSLE